MTSDALTVRDVRVLWEAAGHLEPHQSGAVMDYIAMCEICGEELHGESICRSHLAGLLRDLSGRLQKEILRIEALETALQESERKLAEAEKQIDDDYHRFRELQDYE